MPKLASRLHEYREFDITTKNLFCLCVLLVSCAATFAADIPEYPFVFVLGRADIDTPPDIAFCSVNLHAVDADPGKAESTVDERLKSVLTALSANHVAASDIESHDISKQTLTNNEYNSKDPAVIRGYDVSRALKFTVRQLDSLAAIEAPLVGEPNIDNIDCRFDRKDRKDIEAELLTKALRSARDEADKLAEPLGRHVTEAVAVSKFPFDSIAGSFGQGDSSSAESRIRMFKKSVMSDALLVPYTISLSASVNVLFKME